MEWLRNKYFGVATSIKLLDHWKCKRRCENIDLTTICIFRRTKIRRWQVTCRGKSESPPAPHQALLRLLQALIICLIHEQQLSLVEHLSVIHLNIETDSQLLMFALNQRGADSSSQAVSTDDVKFQIRTTFSRCNVLADKVPDKEEKKSYELLLPGFSDIL